MGYSYDEYTEDKARIWNMFLGLSGIGVAWNFEAYLVGFRWLSRSPDANRKNEKIEEQLLGLVYDGVIEISAAYTAFAVLDLKFLPR